MKKKLYKEDFDRGHLEAVLEQISEKSSILIEGQRIANEKISKLEKGQKSLDQKLDSKFGTLSLDLEEFKKETRSSFRTIFGYLSSVDDELKSIPVEKELAKR